MADLIVRCAIVIAALSPIWRRLYIEHFWVRGRATVIQVNREFITDGEGMDMGWVWVPKIEYYADGQRWEAKKGPHSKYHRVGDQFDILYNPRKPWRYTLDAWSHWIWAATLTGAPSIIFALVISDAWSNWIWAATPNCALGMIFALLISSFDPAENVEPVHGLPGRNPGRGGLRPVAPQSLRRSAGASISADDLYVRYKIACDLKQPVDRDRIAGAIHRWCGNFGIASVAIQFVTTAEQIKGAAGAARHATAAWRAAWDAWWRARRAWCTWATRAAWARAARDAGAVSAFRALWAAEAVRAARNTWAAEDAWGAAWDLSDVSIAAIGAASEGEEAALQKWLPLLEAFEAGAFCLWIGAETIYVAIIPSVVAVDDRRRLHCADGPAFAWLDDIREFYWHGVNVPDFVIERPREIAVEHIDAEQNSEVRRVMIERYRLGDEIHGAGAFMRDAGGKRLDHDERFGTLWRRDVKGDEPIVILEVVNSTREPDGSFKHYWLRVPPNMKTAHEASAWTFDIEPAKYAPLIET